MATYKQIQGYVKDKHGFSVKTCWIAHMKEIHGLNPRVSNRRISLDDRKHPCPPEKQTYITEAFKHFSLI